LRAGEIGADNAFAKMCVMPIARLDDLAEMVTQIFGNGNSSDGWKGWDHPGFVG